MNRTAPDWPSLDASLDALVASLAESDAIADEAGSWPGRLWSILVDHGATRWALPEALGGPSADRASLVIRYAKVAEGSLVAAFILTQHDAAIRRLVAARGEGKASADAWLARIAKGKIFPTVGISQLTTSRRHGPRAMVAREAASGFVLDGAMPWVTAAERADLFVTGGVLDDGRQLLAAVPRDRRGLSVRPAFELAALGASRTSEIVCEGVSLDREDVLVGPSMDVMSTPGLAGTGGLETSALAMGQARAALVSLVDESTRRDDLIEPATALSDAWRDAASGLLWPPRVVLTPRPRRRFAGWRTTWR